MIKIGDRIRELREKANLGQPDLAAIAAYAKPSAISAIENGHTALPLKKVGVIATALGVSADEMVEGTDYEEKWTREKARRNAIANGALIGDINPLAKNDHFKEISAVFPFLKTEDQKLVADIVKLLFARG